MTDSNSDIKLKKGMTLFNSVTMIVGSIIGAGIFVSPTGIIRYSGSIFMSLFVWLFCGIFSMIGAYCYAELGTSIKESGADYAYILAAYGEMAAFLRMWVECIIAKPALTAIVALTFSEYILYPLMPCGAPIYLLKIIVVLIILLVGFINNYSVKLANRVQDFTTIGKSIALLIIIVLGIYMYFKGSTQYISRPFDHSIWDINKLSLAVYYGLFSFNGWNYLNFVVEEMKNPVRDLPRAITISCVFVVIIYLLTNISYFSVLDPVEFVNMNGIAIQFSTKILGKIGIVMAFFVAVSTFGGVNSQIITSSRMSFVAARRGHMPQLMHMIHINNITPFVSVSLTTIISILFGVFADVDWLIKCSGIVNWLAIGVSVTCIFVFRKKYPHMKRPIKVHIAWPIIYLILTVFLIIIPFIESPMETGIGILMILSGIPVYLLFVTNKKRDKIDQIINHITKSVQKVFLLSLEKKSDEEQIELESLESKPFLIKT
ncbi:Solute carrier family 7 member 6 [Intoshia linei]|uniref:Solute carrier family 7 member 6 n=1 Tax=Intoshia linei TaxID=1819745 RepID=A0A177B2T4_9BILA|nr:Solute carrier family 7 member 6 [Intoshia linei]